jgi:predicted phosphodiesterase
MPDYDYDQVSPVAYEISLPDFHYGKRGPIPQERNNLDFMKAVKQLHEKAKGLNIERFILPIGNDGLNSEGYSRATTKGTPQHDSEEWQQTFRGYWKLLVRAIDYLAAFAPVDVIVVQGNHDFERMFYIGEVIESWYRDYKTVTVDNSYDSRKYYKYGNNMIMFTHGDKERPADMPLLMATEKPTMFSQCKHREVHCGHQHREIVRTFSGVKVRFLPSIATNDAWHKMMGYHSLREAQAYIWNKTKGCEGYLQVNL